MSNKSIQIFSEEVLQLMPYIFKGVLRQTDALTSGQITISQFLALSLMNNKGQVKMKDIAKDFNISLPAATGIVQRLFNLELVKRVDDKADRRVIRIVVTPKGKKIVEQISAKRKELIGSIFGKLSEKERENYLQILRKLKKIISAGAGRPASK